MLAVCSLSALAAAMVEEATTFTKVTTADVLAQLNYKFSFEAYAAEYGKVYSAEEKPARKAAFEAALDAIKAHNTQVPPASWKMGLNEHSAWSDVKHGPSVSIAADDDADAPSLLRSLR